MPRLTVNALEFLHRKYANTARRCSAPELRMQKAKNEQHNPYHTRAIAPQRNNSGAFRSLTEKLRAW